ncbi:MAG: hypothetical protein Q4D71_12385, partial [Oscillospiraceae bacterium]|nr:hypothetical protein [Oscillospiraceae bacterium]
MRYIRTRAVAEAIKTAERSAFLAAKLRPRMADNKEESRSTDISSEAADKVMAAGRKAAGSVTRGKIFGKKKTAMRTRTAGLEAGLDRRSSKWIKTSETAGKNDVRTSETQHTEDLKADRITVQERARGSAAAKKALHVQKQTAAGIRAAAGSAKRIAGKMLRSALRAVNAQNAMIIGGGALAVCAVIIISMVGGIAASPFGIFFSIEEDGGASLRSILSDLSKEFYDPI